MAKSKLSFKRSITDKLSVKGVLSEDCTYITYCDKNNQEQDILVADMLSAFKNQEIEFAVSLKNDEDLEVITSDNE